MNWSQAIFVVDAEAVEPLSAILETFLAQAITTENAGSDDYLEAAFPKTPSWKKVRVTALFDQAVDLQPILDFVQQTLGQEFGTEIPVSVTQLKDQDWERVWLSSFSPVKVGDDLWVCPSWCDPEEPQARNIYLDPGLAFGTGTHATTHLCLSWLAENPLSGLHVLDYGAGSGILAIAAVLCGADSADAVDIDPLAVQASMDNAARNNVAKAISAYLPTELPQQPAGRYDLVIANILADVIIELRDTLLHHLKPGGVLLLTGILNNQAERVIQCFDGRLTIKRYQQGDWCMLVAKDNEFA